MGGPTGFAGAVVAATPRLVCVLGMGVNVTLFCTFCGLFYYHSAFFR